MKNKLWIAALGAVLLGSAEARAEDDNVESPALMYTGGALTVVGGLGLAGGTGAFIAILNGGGDLAGVGAVIVAGPILVTSSVLLHVGIPLWAFGASEKDEVPPAWTGEVRLGPSGGDFVVRF